VGPDRPNVALLAQVSDVSDFQSGLMLLSIATLCTKDRYTHKRHTTQIDCRSVSSFKAHDGCHCVQDLAATATNRPFLGWRAWRPTQYRNVGLFYASLLRPSSLWSDPDSVPGDRPYKVRHLTSPCRRITYSCDGIVQRIGDCVPLKRTTARSTDLSVAAQKS